MGVESSPAVSRRRLAAELRRRREAAGKTIQDVAEHLECSAGKVSRVETGLVAARIQDVREMLDLYGVGNDERRDLLDLVRDSRKKAWWHAYIDLVPADSATFYGLEDGAATIDVHSVALVPGLLQTEAYARALLGSAPDLPDDVLRRKLELRLLRQQILTRANPPRLHVVLHEAVLLSRIGGVDTTVQQLRHLLQLAARPNITLQLLPFDVGAYTAAGVSFTIFGFTEPADPKIVYLEQLTRNVHLEAPSEIGRYTAAFDELRAIARTPEQSVQACADAIKAAKSAR